MYKLMPLNHILVKLRWYIFHPVGEGTRHV